MSRTPRAIQDSLPGAQVAPVWDPVEKEFQAQVIELAHVLSWTVAHFRPAMTKHGWRTPAGADGAGFVDLVLAGRGRVLFRELKTRHGRLSDDQKAWGELLTRNGADYAVWRPSMWDEIATDLGAKG